MHTKAFTLIELLVVISIISVLAAIIFPSFSQSRKTARVGQRVTNMKQVQAALEFYYAANHAYPTTSGVWTSCPTTVAAAAALIPGLTPTYLATIPTDPQWTAGQSGTANCYLYDSDGTNYAFRDDNVTEMESGQGTPNYLSYPELIDPARDGGQNNSIVDGSTVTAWKVFSPGAISW
jgi:prepilin-type N-terminal cleavage/methylation domain-containing protein